MIRFPSVYPGSYLKGHRLSNFIGWAAISLAALAAAALTTIATFNYPGQRLVFVTFAVVSLVMIALVVPQPRLYGYTFLAVFLFLGFCAKSVAYFGLKIAFVEPTGNFNGTGSSWDTALVVAIAGLIGVLAIRAAHLAGVRVRGRRGGVKDPVGPYPPDWYVHLRAGIIALSIAAIIGLNFLNLITALYQVGVSPRLVLPMHLNVVVSWLITTGLALWATTLFGWEVRLHPSKSGGRLLIPLIEAICTMSTLSRAAYLFRALPYVAVLADHPSFYRQTLTKRWRRVWLLLLPAGFVLSLVAVSLLRVIVYPSAPPELPPTAVAATPSLLATPRPAVASASSPALAVDQINPRIGWITHEISTMVVGRWIGIEGTMAVSSYQGLGLRLFGQGLVENPRAGEAAIYQRISGSGYSTSSQFVFLTTPGAVAILYYAGSLPLVALGMGLLTGLLVTFEILASRLITNSFAVAIFSLALANAIAQADFPYLLLVAFAEQSAAVVVFGILIRLNGGTRVIAAESEMSA